MLHSNLHERELESRQEREREYALANEKYLNEARAKRPAPLPEKEKKKTFPKFCCGAVLVVVCLSVALIYYFVVSIKDPLINDYFKKKAQIEGLLPQGKEELKKSLEQGEQLYDETKQNVDNINATYNQAKDIVEKGEQIKTQVEQAMDKLQEAVK